MTGSLVSPVRSRPSPLLTRATADDHAPVGGRNQVRVVGRRDHGGDGLVRGLLEQADDDPSGELLQMGGRLVCDEYVRIKRRDFSL
jgi:hypothetical protein